MAETHTLGGRTFLTMQESTVKQDLTFLALIHDAGIEEIQMQGDEAPGDYALRLLNTVVGTGVLLPLLGCLLVPAELVPRKRRWQRRHLAGEVWTPELGDATAAFLGELRGEEDKAKIRSLILTLLLHFFESGITSLWTSQTSSDEAIPVPVEGGLVQPDAMAAGPPSS